MAARRVKSNFPGAQEELNEAGGSLWEWCFMLKAMTYLHMKHGVHGARLGRV